MGQFGFQEDPRRHGRKSTTNDRRLGTFGWKCTHVHKMCPGLYSLGGLRTNGMFSADNVDSPGIYIDTLIILLPK